MDELVPRAAVADRDGVADPRWSPDGRRLAWLRLTASDAAIVVAPAVEPADARELPVDPAPARVRPGSGGAIAWTGDGGLLYASADGALWRVPVPAPGEPAGAASVVVAGEGGISAPAVAPDGSLVAFVLETDAACWVAVAPLDGSAPPRRLSTADWAWDPTWSSSGLLAWHEWDFPMMSWDASRVVVTDAASGFARASVVAGGDAIAVGQPRFGPVGDALAYVSDEDGWWNVWLEPEPRAAPSRGRRPVLVEPFEHAEPAWGVGQRSFAWSPNGDAIALCRNERGFGRLVVVSSTGPATDVARGWHHSLEWGRNGIVAVRSGARTAPAVTVTAPDGSDRRVLDGRAPAGVDREQLREAEPVDWIADDGEPVHGLLWGPEGGQRPSGTGPLLVDVHGGPTGQATVAWNLRLQYLVARGFTVLQPNPRGSTGSGRPYAQALTGRWGELDVDDVAAGVRAAPVRGWGDPTRVALLGGSSGGMLALLVCARHAALVRAAVVAYPVTDLLDLAETTHRFEAHYSDRLIGPLPDAADRYRARSPIAVAGALRTPLLVLQGDTDPVVAPAQTDRFVAAVRGAGAPVEYHRYEGEGHGWSRPETVLDALERTEAFLVHHLGAP